MGQVRLWNKLPKNPGYVPVLHSGSVNAEEASPHAKFYNLSTGYDANINLLRDITKIIKRRMSCTLKVVAILRSLAQ